MTLGPLYWSPCPPTDPTRRSVDHGSHRGTARLLSHRFWRGFRAGISVSIALLLLIVLPNPTYAWQKASEPGAEPFRLSDRVLIPYLPHAELIAGTGPWYSALTVANGGAYPIEVEIRGADGTFLTSVGLPAFGSTVLGSGTLYGNSTGRALQLTGREAGACAPTAIQRLTVQRGPQPDSVDTIPLPIPDGVVVTHRIVSQGTVYYQSPVDLFQADYVSTQVGTTGMIDWSPAFDEPIPNSTYTVLVVYDPVCRPARLSAAVKAVAPIEAVAGRTTAAHLMVTGYTALPADRGAGETLHLPIAQGDYSGWNTTVYVTNFGALPCAVTATLFAYPNGQVTAAPETILQAGTTWQFDVASIVPSGWLGSVRLSGAVCDIAAVGTRIKAQQPWGTPVNMALSDLALPPQTLSTTAFVPLVFQAYFD